MKSSDMAYYRLVFMQSGCNGPANFPFHSSANFTGLNTESHSPASRATRIPRIKGAKSYSACNGLLTKYRGTNLTPPPQGSWKGGCTTGLPCYREQPGRGFCTGSCRVSQVDLEVTLLGSLNVILKGSCWKVLQRTCWKVLQRTSWRSRSWLQPASSQLFQEPGT